MATPCVLLIQGGCPSSRPVWIILLILYLVNTRTSGSPYSPLYGPPKPQPCPVEPPCFCARTWRGEVDVKRITCGTVPFSHSFPALMPGTNDILKSLSLIYSDLQSIPNGAFLHVHAAQLDLQGNNFTDNIGPKAFFGVSKRLLSLNMAWSNITSLKARVFRGMVSLRNLTLAENRIKHLSSHIFQDMRSLEKLSLAGNPLDQLPPAMFRYQANLQELDLGYCSLSKIPWSLFSGLWNLQYLDLRGNNIHSLDLYTFGDLLSLHTLQLSHNPLRRLQSRVFYGLSNLQVLKLEEGLLEDIEYDVFRDTKRLVDVDLGDNRLSTLRVGTLLIPPLTHLRLDGNFLRSIPHEVKYLTNLKHLDMSYNLMETIDKCVVQDLDKLEFLNLRENPFVCDCSLFWLKEYERKLMKQWKDRRKPIPFVPGKCQKPDRLRGITITRWLDLDCLRQHYKQSVHSCHRFWYW